MVNDIEFNLTLPNNASTWGKDNIRVIFRVL